MYLGGSRVHDVWRKEFGLRLKEARKAKGLSQEKLCAISGVHVTTIQGYEYGKNDPYVRIAIRLADALGISVEYLLTGKVEQHIERTPYVCDRCAQHVLPGAWDFVVE
jgi:transcriptional regulator with XRE-family HTH domain